MNKRKDARILFLRSVWAAWVCCVSIFSLSASAASEGGGGLEIGRDNPFAEIAQSRFIPRTALLSSGSDDLPGMNIPELYVETVTLKFLKAKSLKSALDSMSSSYGSIAIDDNTNSLIICDTKGNLERILAEVRKANQTPQQIMIEVVIVDVLLRDDTEIGVDWDILSDETYDVAYRQGMVWPDRLRSTKADADSIGDATAFMTVGLGGEFSLVSGTIRSVVNLLQQKRTIEILASPRVLVLSGQQAQIKTVEEIPYQERTDTSGGGLLTSTEFKEIGVTLQVKATLVEDNNILMEIRPTQSVDTGVSIADVPIVDTREAETTLLMEDGQVVVMGGLRRKETKMTRYQVPILGDLPLIGFIFGNDRKIVENSELLVLISPHIHKGEPPSDNAMAKYDEITQRPLPAIPQDQQPKAGQ